MRRDTLEMGGRGTEAARRDGVEEECADQGWESRKGSELCVSGHDPEDGRMARGRAEGGRLRTWQRRDHALADGRPPDWSAVVAGAATVSHRRRGCLGCGALSTRTKFKLRLEGG